jgi:outer membrane lipoprotein carrier protein
VKIRVTPNFSAQRFLTKFWLPLLTLALASVGPACSQEPPTDALTRFEARYRAAKSLSATFLEEYQDNGKVTRKEAGNAYFQRPGKMRWDYEAPEKNVFLVDGKFAWFYSPADRTVEKMPAKSSEDWRTPLALLTSDMKLNKVCATIQPATNETPSAPQNKVYKCRVREEGQRADHNDASFEEAYFDLTPDGELSRISIRERGGVSIQFSFANWQWNPPLEKKLFVFGPPAGVAIVDGLLPDSTGSRQ